MAVHILALFLVTEISFVFTAVNGMSDAIVDVYAVCAPDTNGTTQVYLASDEPLAVTIKCKDDNSFKVSRFGTSEYFNTTVQYTGDSSSYCVFKKKSNTEVYEVDLEIAHSYGIETVLDVYRVTCTYEKYKADVDLDVGMADSLEPRKQLETHLGHNASSNFSIEVQDVFGIPILDGEIKYGQKIRLVITMSPTSGTPIEQGFKVLHCNAVDDSGAIKYPFLRNGCGDGHVFERHAGFITDGLKARSPYFKPFRLYGSDTVSFQCIFNTCDVTCNGDSCTVYKSLIRRKREVKENPDIKKAKDLLIAEISTDSLKVKASTVTKDKPLKSIIGLKHSNAIQITHKAKSGKTNETSGEKSTTSGRQFDKDLKEHYQLADSKKYSMGLKNPAKISRISSRTLTKKTTGGLNVDQIGVIVGCSSFIVMVALFVGIFMYHLRQKTKVESQLRAYRIEDLDSSTCLLSNEST